MERSTYRIAREINIEINQLGKIHKELEDKYIVGIIYRQTNLKEKSKDKTIYFSDINKCLNISVQIKSLLLTELMRRVVSLKNKFSNL